MSMSIIPSVIVQMITHYGQLKPRIEKNVFEQLAQINATLLGFTLSGFLITQSVLNNVLFT